ncbi:MAG TPA: hypothetical protein VFD38_15905 [Myxococcaceae bacterium]|nr:hypothetical protein [Myxococcaceae bacterium]
MLDPRGRRIGSVRKVGEEHLEVTRVLRPPLLVPLSSVQALDAKGVHVNASAPELSEGTVEAEGATTQVAPVASVEQARSSDLQRWSDELPTTPQDHPANGD